MIDLDARLALARARRVLRSPRVETPPSESGPAHPRASASGGGFPRHWPARRPGEDLVERAGRALALRDPVLDALDDQAERWMAQREAYLADSYLAELRAFVRGDLVEIP